MFLETPKTGVDNIRIDTLLLVDDGQFTPSLLKIEEETAAEDRPIVV
jgi:hypothetical protein